MKRKSVIEPLIYLAAIAVVLAVLPSIGNGWFEYQNFDGATVFRYDTSAGSYTAMFDPNGSYNVTNWPGFQLYRWNQLGHSFFDVQVAHWVLTLPIAIPAVVGTALVIGGRRRINRRVARGQCVKCGYDLTATPDRCPECGAFADRGGI